MSLTLGIGTRLSDGSPCGDGIGYALGMDLCSGFNVQLVSHGRPGTALCDYAGFLVMKSRMLLVSRATCLES